MRLWKRVDFPAPGIAPRCRGRTAAPAIGRCRTRCSTARGSVAADRCADQCFGSCHQSASGIVHVIPRNRNVPRWHRFQSPEDHPAARLRVPHRTRACPHSPKFYCVTPRSTTRLLHAVPVESPSFGGFGPGLMNKHVDTSVGPRPCDGLQRSWRGGHSRAGSRPRTRSDSPRQGACRLECARTSADLGQGRCGDALDFAGDLVEVAAHIAGAKGHARRALGHGEGEAVSGGV